MTALSLDLTATSVELTRVLASRPQVVVVDRGWMQTMRRPAAARDKAGTVAGDLFPDF